MKASEKAGAAVAVIAVFAMINAKGTVVGGQIGLGIIIIAVAGRALAKALEGSGKGSAKGRSGRRASSKSAHPSREIGAMLRTLVASTWKAANPDHANLDGTAAAAADHKKAKRHGTSAASGFRPVKTSRAEMLREAAAGITALFRPSRLILRGRQAAGDTAQPAADSSGKADGTAGAARPGGGAAGTGDSDSGGTGKGPSPAGARPGPAPEDAAADSAGSDAPAGAPHTHQEDPDMTNAAFASLWEAGDSLGRNMPSLYDVRAFVYSISRGTLVTAAFYQQLQQRMAGPMHIDPIVTEPIGKCASNQQVIAEAVRSTAIALDDIMTGTMDQLLDRGVRVPNHSQLQKDNRVPAVIPRFFQLIGLLDRQPFADVRMVLCMVKALRDASEGQARLYTHTRNRLLEGGYDHLLVDRWTVAARCQTNITTLLTDADAQFTMLLTMTIERLIDSGYMAPNAHLVDA